MNRSMTKNYILMSFAMLFWGASFVFIKIVYRYVGPLTMIFGRLLIASTALLLIYILNSKRDIIRKRDCPIFFFMGFTEPFIYFLGEGYGMKFVSSTHASVIIATIPIFAMLGAMLVYREKVFKINVFGIFISFLGILVMIGVKGLQAEGSIIGFALMFLAVFAAVINSMIIFKLGDSYSSLTIITFQNIVGTLLFLPLFILFESSSLSAVIINREFILAMVFLALFPSVLSFLLYISVLKQIGVAKTGAFSNVIPIVTGIISFILLGTRFQVNEVIGIIFVITGLFLSQRTNPIPYEG